MKLHGQVPSVTLSMFSFQILPFKNVSFSFSVCLFLPSSLEEKEKKQTCFILVPATAGIETMCTKQSF